MNALQQFYQAFKTRLTRFKARALVWLTRHSVLFNKVYPTHPARRIAVMKARLFNFYLDNIQPRLATGKARLVQIKQRLIAGLDHRRWWARTGLVVANVALVLLLHWPTFSPYQHALGRLVMLLPPGAALLYFLGRLVPARTRQRMTAWFSRPGLPGTAGLAIALVAGASLTYLWLTWPAWQAGVQGGLVHVGLLLTGLWAFLKTPLQRSRLILVTPHPFPQDDMPVPAGDGRLL